MAFEIITNPLYQRNLGADDHQLDALIETELTEFLEVIDSDSDIGTNGAGAGVAGGYEKLRTEGALFNFPGEGMFATSGPNDEDVHWVRN